MLWCVLWSCEEIEKINCIMGNLNQRIFFSFLSFYTVHTNCFNLDIFSLYFLQLLFFLLNFSSSFLTFYLPALLCPWLIPSTWVDPFETVGLPYSWGLADGSQTSSNQKYLAIQRQCSDKEGRKEGGGWIYKGRMIRVLN